MTEDHPFIPYVHLAHAEDEMVKRSRTFYQLSRARRSIREFSERPVPRQIIENIIKTAGTAPSGANKQPWTFVVVSDLGLKREIRTAAESVEKDFYDRRISDEWRQDLAPLKTSWQKPFLETAPYLIVVFRQNYGLEGLDQKRGHYYVLKSVGIAVGILITAIHNAGLVTLTYTPAPMDFLSEILRRPRNEKPFMVLPVGYPAENVRVPDIQRKKLSEIMIWK
ncbi:MAG: nitroreductase family protein [Candidatus Odinarchaeota archaeon]